MPHRIPPGYRVIIEGWQIVGTLETYEHRGESAMAWVRLDSPQGALDGY